MGIDRLDRPIPLFYDKQHMQLKADRSRVKKGTGFRFAVVWITAAILTLPFVHLHPRITHADRLGEHTHAGVIHTLFSLGDSDHPSHSPNGLNLEESPELLRASVNLNPILDRLVSLSGTGISAAAFSFLESPFFARSPRRLSIQTDDLPALSGPVSHRAVRAPPTPHYS